MRILYFHQHFTTPAGSAGTRSYEMALSLVRAGHQVTMVCGSHTSGKTGLNGPFTKGKRSGYIDGIRIIEFNLVYGNQDNFLKRGATFMKFAWRSILVALGESSDLVFATSTPLTAGIPGIIAKWLQRKPFIFEVRDLWPELPKAMGAITNPLVLSTLRVLEWTSYKSADRLIGLSPGIVDGIARDITDRSRIALIPNGCDFELFSGAVEPWRPHNVSETDVMAIFTGTHGHANGLLAVIEAAAELKARGVTSIKLVLVGDGAEKSMLEERVQSDLLDDIVVFLDPIPKTKLSGLMASANVGLQILANVPAFYYGTSPNKFFDYLAAGLPVITNYPGWVADLITEHECGIAVAPNSPTELANALMKIQADPALKQKGANARQLGKAKFSRKELGDSFVNFVVRTPKL